MLETPLCSVSADRARFVLLLGTHQLQICCLETLVCLEYKLLVRFSSFIYVLYLLVNLFGSGILFCIRFAVPLGKGKVLPTTGHEDPEGE
jgi:hypothetical protein